MTKIFFRKIETVISHPHKFFNAVKKEKNIAEVFKFYFVFVFLSIIINMIFILPDFAKDNLDIPFLRYVLFVFVMVLFVLAVTALTALSSFIIYWMYHLLVRLFRGKESYTQTYKLIYAATPLLIVMLIPFYGIFKFIFYPLFIIAAVDTLYIEFVGLQRLQNMKKNNAIAVIIISILIAVWFLRLLITKGFIVL